MFIYCIFLTKGGGYLTNYLLEYSPGTTDDLAGSLGKLSDEAIYDKIDSFNLDRRVGECGVADLL